MNKNDVETNNHTLQKNVSKLKEPTKRAKRALITMLEKRLKGFQDQAAKSSKEEEKALFLKKTEKISKDLDVLKVLSEDEIIRYSLSVVDKIMSLASNMRVPREQRLKARVAAHKPLYPRLRRLNQKHGEPHNESAESESEEEPESSPTLDKMSFNNMIVSMRKDVRRAKVHTIHKLTRNIAKFRAVKGEEGKVAKFHRKAERLHKKVVHIKELHEDEIAKFALTTTQNVNQLAFDVKVPTISQALATVAINKFVVPHVTNFRTKYPEWQKIVPNLLKKKKKKHKLNLEPKDSKNVSNELSKGNEASENEDSGSDSEHSGTEENGSASEDGDSTESKAEEQSEAGSCDSSESEAEDESESDQASQDGGGENSSGSEDEDASDENSKTESDVNNKFVKRTTNIKDSTKVKSKTVTSKKVIKPKESTKGKSSVSSEHIENKPVKEKPKVVDPFFMTTSNKEYETSQVPVSLDQSTSNKKTEYFDGGRHDKFINVDSKRKWERTKDVGSHEKFSRFQSSAPYPNTNQRNFNRSSSGPKTDQLVFGNRKERRKILHQPQVEEKVEKLHPSWEAKKKQSVIIPFQGKKVTFD